ncbi:MAG TPA: sigma-70 family RNA polymerase sigma factor [Parvularculaceae bacterium]|nr:sigma-70 family RNA polymerase sigma factor [Parvularculaceae bacterium]
MSADDGFSKSPTASSALDLEDAYRSYHEPLVSFLSNRLPERSIAADIAHTVFASLAARPAIQSIRDMRQYLFRAARNQLADYYRKEDFQTEGAARYAADPVVSNGDAALSPEEEAIRQDKLERLRSIIDAMPRKRRTVFLLARFQELTETEIAACLGMKRTAVRQHVSRAMRDCQTEMMRIFEETSEDNVAGTLNGRAAHKR